MLFLHFVTALLVATSYALKLPHTEAERAMKCNPLGLPIDPSPVKTLKGYRKLFVSEDRRGAKRFRLGGSTDIANFGFYRVTQLFDSKAGTSEKFQLYNGQLFSSLGGEVLSRRNQNTKDLNLYFAADATAVTQKVQVVKACTADGKQIQTLALPGALGLFYKKLMVNGTVGPGAAVSMPQKRETTGLTKVFVEVE